MKHKTLPDGQPPTVAFSVPVQLCGPKAKETEMVTALFTKGDGGETLTSTVFAVLC